ncbi:metallophosphoesterase [Komagataeibacter sp. NFXK3]
MARDATFPPAAEREDAAPPAPPALPTHPLAGLLAGRPLRVVGDVHGDLHAFRHAAATDRFVIQLGDLVDYGPDSAGAFRLIDEGRGLFILGNHDRKLARALQGRKMRRDPPLMETLAAFLREENSDVYQRALADLAKAPAWIVLGHSIFVHGGFHARMLGELPPPGLGTVTPLLSRALFGETTGRMQKDGYPERRLNWVDHIPPGYTVYCGHDRRSTDGRPWVRNGRMGGRAIFTDTGAGKGGHLAWIDLPPVL